MPATHADQLRLLDLQALDTRLTQLRYNKAHHPTLARIAELEGQMKDLHVSLVDSQTAVSDLERDLRKAEADVETVADRIKRSQERIDYGGISAKDTQALVTDLESMKARHGILEEAQLELMERLDAHRESLAQVQDGYAELETAKTAVEAERDAALTEINTEGRAVITERAEAVKDIDAGLVKTYEQIRDRKGGIGAAALEGGRCSGCGLEITGVDLAAAKAAPLDQVLRCEDCGRILVRLKDLNA